MLSFVLFPYFMSQKSALCRKVGSYEHTLKELGEKECELASATATGIVVCAEESIATSTEGKEKDNPENAASATIVGIVI